MKQHSHVYMNQSCFVKIHVSMIEIARQRGNEGSEERHFPVVVQVLDDYFGCLLSAPIRVSFIFLFMLLLLLTICAFLYINMNLVENYGIMNN